MIALNKIVHPRVNRITFFQQDAFKNLEIGNIEETNNLESI